MKLILASCTMVLLAGMPAAAQTGRVYAGAVAGIDVGSRGPIEGGSIPMAGAILGARLSDRWSVEFEVEKGFRTSRRMFSLYGVEKAGIGWSALGVWRTRGPGRVGAALMAGYTARRFSTEQPEGTIKGHGVTAGFMLPIRAGGALTIAPEIRATLGLITDESEYYVVRYGFRVLYNF